MEHFMKPPKNLTIYGKRCPIKVVKTLYDDDGHPLEGCFHSREFEILLTVCSHQTLLHESLHALFDRIGIRQVVSSEVEEVLVENVANYVTDTYDLRFKRKK